MFRSVGIRSLAFGVREVPPLIVLSAVALYLSWPFLTARFVGASDAVWYYGLLADYLQQIHAGVFPVYVGQSQANWNGHPPVLAPMYLLTGAAIDLVTGERYTPIEVQHLTLVWSICAGTFSAYFCIKALPSRRWLSVALACLYVSCPGLLWLPGGLDMYPSFMTIPYLPLLLYGLIRGARRADGVATAFIAGGLTLLWMSHAPIALWCTAASGLFLAGLAVFSGRFWRTVRFAMGVGVAFTILSAWYFGTIFSLGLQRSHTMNKESETTSTLFNLTGPAFADSVMPHIWESLPGIYFPLGDDFQPMIALQLGYALWCLLLCAVAVAVRARILELRLLVALALGLLVVLHPVPGVTWNFWAHLPRAFLITEQWPMERFYVILAGLSAFAAALATEQIISWGRSRFLVVVAAPTTRTAPRQHPIPVRAVFLGMLVFLGLAYSLQQAGKVRAWGFKVRGREPVPSISLPENQPLHWCNWIAVRDPRTGVRDVSVADPVLYDRLLAVDVRTVLAENQETARRGTTTPPMWKADVAFPLTPEPNTPPRQLLHFRIEPRQQYLLTLQLVSRNAYGAFIVEGKTLQRMHRPLNNTGSSQTAAIPIWTTSDEPQEVRVSLSYAPLKPSEPSSIEITQVEVSAYQSDALPVRIHSLMPYTATVAIDRPCLLEAHREFVPGYEALVNGKRVEPSRSPDGMLMVPLPAGNNEVQLIYHGTALARATFALSSSGWLALMGLALFRFWRRLVIAEEQPVSANTATELHQ